MAPPAQRHLLLASGNQGKLDELRRLLVHLPVRVQSPSAAGIALPPVHEDGLTFQDNAVKKALSAASVCGHQALVLADDSGLEVDALDGAPGVRSARFAGSKGSPAQRDAANNSHLLHLLAGIPPDRRTARFVCVLAVAAGRRIVATARGQVDGLILDQPRGKGGFGYDPLFLHPSSGRTFAQMSPTEKQAISHRGRALAELLAIAAGGGLDGWC